MKKFLTLITLILCINTAFSLTDKEIKDAYYSSYKYEKMQDYEDAIKALMVVYNAYPSGYTVNLRLGWLYYLYKKYANSIYHYKKAIKSIPYSIEAKLGLTLPLLAQAKYIDVQKICYEILKTDYYNYYANLRLSYVFRLTKNYDLAAKVDNKMLSIYPTDIKFLTELALIKYHLSDKSTAKKLFKDILILDPENYTAKQYLTKLNSK